MSSNVSDLPSTEVTIKEDFQILLYYKFVQVENPQELVDSQRELCEQLGLKGRILVGLEGLNGTVSGPRSSTDAYREWAASDLRFADMPFKIDKCEGHVFPKLSIKFRDEIVTLGLSLNRPVHEATGDHLSPAKFCEMLDDPNVIIIDGRSDYEFDLGHFKGAIRPNAEVFKEFPKWLEAQQFDKDRTILTYCTGGIRCEKLTAFMKQEGFTRAYQLDGGIINYGHDPEVRGAGFLGQCYVFDQRIAVPVNSVDPEVVGRCYHCQSPTETYVNCASVDCNLQFLACCHCEEVMERCCSDACVQSTRKRSKGGKLASSVCR